MSNPFPEFRNIIAVAILAAAVGLALTPPSAAKATAADRFSGDISSLISPSQLAAADITGECVQKSSQGKAVLTYIGHWGENANAPHWLGVTVWKPEGNAEFFYATYKNEASKDRAPIGIGNWAFWKTERYNGDRRKGDIMFRAGDYVCLITLNDDNGAPDEVGIQTSLFSIAKEMTAKLQ